jgi:uncharacterized Zn finger protein
MTTVVHPRLAPRRGARATTWWGKAWVRAIEEAAYADDELAAGRALARGGHVGAIAVAEGRYAATVDDRDVPFAVDGSMPVLAAADLDAFVEVVAAEAGRSAALLAGELPHRLVEHAEEAGVELLPYGGELGSSCGCAHWTDPCVHALAVLQQLAWLVDRDPLVLLHLRGLPREQLLSRLEGLRAAAAHQNGSDPALELDLDLAVDAALRAARLLADADQDADQDANQDADPEADAATP